MSESREAVEAYKQRLKDIEQQTTELQESFSADQSMVDAEQEQEKQDIDSRSIYVGNVDYATLPVELQQHFVSAGEINRVTIMKDKKTGNPKGFAYIEFEQIDSVDRAIATLDGSTFRDRELKVAAKRTNIPGLSSRGRGSRGRGVTRSRGRARGRAGFRGSFRGKGGFNPY
ncbi:putative polyadenylate-binding protein 2 [[Candida] jaroonii]|uniref:Polyadenylate-binding protein 2 n=1 Tax=[Candida] jaroonii TaxID=467808 RepID=A0ACA9Y8E9_9ASCO|nr:putative polyadenylate-binding protein 2 [[Candida] jaroonii]